VSRLRWAAETLGSYHWSGIDDLADEGYHPLDPGEAGGGAS